MINREARFGHNHGLNLDKIRRTLHDNLMAAHSFFLQLMLILLSARLFGEFVSRFKIPAVIGELLAGVLLGPSLLNWVEPTATIKLLAEIGIVLLLFEVGLETDLAKLMKAGTKSFTAAAFGVIAPFVLGFVISYSFFDLSLLVSLFIGSTLTATSIGITMRVLSDLKRQKAAESQIVLGAAVLDDIIGVVLLALLYEFAVQGDVHWFNTGKVLLSILLFLILAPLVGKIISLLIQRYEQKSEIPGLLPATIVALLLFFAWLAHQVGAPELLGGFAAGLAFSHQPFLSFKKFLHTEEQFTQKVETQMRPIIYLFTPIFFVTVGLSLNLREIDWSSGFIWALSLSLLVAAVVGKLACGFCLFSENRFIKGAVGLAMIPRGEMGLVFADVGKEKGIFNQELYAALIIVIALTTLIAPFVLRRHYELRDGSH
jgi:Kef-type K+ transport system membrane component KefB